MNTVERILAAVSGFESQAIGRVRVGRKYVAVELGDGSVGVGLTQLPEGLGCCDGADLSGGARANAEAMLLRVADDVAALSTTERLLPLLRSSDPVRAAVALACVNALANREDVELLDDEILEHLKLRSSDTVGMVGLFRPVLPFLKRTVGTIHIFERHEGEGLLAADEGLRMLPTCDVAILTAGAITNGTIDRLLDAASPCREVVLLGASVPFLAPAFADTSVTWLSGSVVMDKEATLRTVAQGGGRREFNAYLKKGSMGCKSASARGQSAKL